MFRHIDNVEISLRYRCIESYRIGGLNIDFFDISSCAIFISILEDRFHIFLDSRPSAGNKEFSYDRDKIDLLTQYPCLTI